MNSFATKGFVKSYQNRYSIRLYFLVLCSAALLAMPSSALPDTHEQPTVVLHVDGKAKPGEGTHPRVFASLTAALASARDHAAQNHRVIVMIKAGEYFVSETLRLDFPVELHGSNKPLADSNYWPLGAVRKNSETRLVAGFCSGPLIAISGDAGTLVSNVTVQNLTLQGGVGACTVLEVLKGHKVLIADNIVTGQAAFGIYAVATSGAIVGNYVAGMGSCGICIGAGTEDSPTELVIADNRSVSNLSGGLLLAGTSYPLPEFGNSLDVDVVHNDLSGNDRNTALGFGVRVLAIGTIPSLSSPSSPVEGQVTARFVDNKITLNNHGVMIDAGEPVRNFPGGCDSRRYGGEINLSFHDNLLADNLIRNAFISFTRAQVITGTAAQSRFQYLHDALIWVDDPGENLASYVLDHPEFDRFTGGVCADDVTNEALFNLMYYNAVEVDETL